MPKVKIAPRGKSLSVCEACQHTIAHACRSVPNRFDTRWPILCEECYPTTPYFIPPRRRVSRYFRASDKKTQAVKARAERDGIEINLLDADIAALICQNCHYCGTPGSVEKPVGIDRKDNDQGYIHGNVLPCCSMCNYLKGTYPYVCFLRKCREIAVKHPG